MDAGNAKATTAEPRQVHELSQHQRTLPVDGTYAVQIEVYLGQSVEDTRAHQAGNQCGHIARPNVGAERHDSQVSVNVADELEAAQYACRRVRRECVDSCHDYICLFVPAGCEVARVRYINTYRPGWLFYNDFTIFLRAEAWLKFRKAA